MNKNVMQPIYYFEKGLRKVNPYEHTFRTHVKQRWIGKTILDALSNDFLGLGNYFKTALSESTLLLNDIPATESDILKASDIICHTSIRHEPPIRDDPITIIHQTNELLVINKPCSLPAHPSGKYFHNSAVNILKNEFNITTPKHRLTSGIMLIALETSIARELKTAFEERKIEKRYVCKVKGKFPASARCFAPIMYDYALGLCTVNENGKQSESGFELSSYDGEHSIVICKPKTGRLHQLRVHLAHLGHPIANDPIYLNARDKRLESPVDKEFPDPDPEKLVLWLHSYYYAGTNNGKPWSYEAEWPSWALE